MRWCLDMGESCAAGLFEGERELSEVRGGEWVS